MRWFQNQYLSTSIVKSIIHKYSVPLLILLILELLRFVLYIMFTQDSDKRPVFDQILSHFICTLQYLAIFIFETCL